jgi:hypothetical protein
MRSWDTAPQWVREAVTRCLHDLQQPTVIDVPLDWVVDALFPDPKEIDGLFPYPDASGDRFSSPFARTGSDLVVACAELLQYQLFPESEGAWGEARPACRGHGHPAKPTVWDGEAWWTCPTTGQPLSLIGAYQHPVDKRTRQELRRERRRQQR